jgi:hypothetical protein
MAIDISFILKSSTDGFKAGMATANNSVMDLKKSLRDFDVGNGLKSLLGVGGIISAFRGTISAAMELRDALQEAGKPIPDAVRSVAELGDHFKAAAASAKEMAISVLSFVTRAGEGYGMVINRIRGITAEQEMLAGQIAKDALATEERIAKAREEYGAKNAAAEMKLADLRRKNSLDAMALDEKAQILSAEISDLESERLDKGKESLRYRELSITIEEKTAEVAKVNAELSKQSAKSAEDEEKFREGIFKASEAMADSLAEIRKDEATAAAQKKNASADAAQSAQDEYNASFLLTGEKEKQSALDEKRNKDIQETLDKLNAGGGGALGQRGLSTVSTDVLRADLQQRSSRLEAQRMAQGSSRGVGGMSFEGQNYFEFSQLNSIKQELAFRDSFQRAFSRGGRSGALSEYASQGRDVQGFDVALSNMSSWGATLSSSERATVKSQETLDQIKNMLTPVFKR